MAARGVARGVASDPLACAVELTGLTVSTRRRDHDNRVLDPGAVLDRLAEVTAGVLDLPRSVAVVVDNDANLGAPAELEHWDSETPLSFVHVSPPSMPTRVDPPAEREPSTWTCTPTDHRPVTWSASRSTGSG